jgi:hypothetical protein
MFDHLSTSSDLEETVLAVEEALDRLRADLVRLTAAGRALARQIAAIKAQIPTPRLVRIHTPPPRDGAKRGRGRPPGAKTRILHVTAATAAEARALAARSSERL